MKLYVEQLENRNLMTVVIPFHTAQAEPLDSQVIFGYTPDQIRHAYGFDQLFSDYNAEAGKGQTIAIVDAFLDANIVNRGITAFDLQYNLPTPDLSIISQRGNINDLPTQSDFGWALETNLDIQWAHAIAPQAKIVLVATDSDNSTDIFAGVNTAKSIVGVTAVSMSFGASEDPSLSANDAVFSGSGVGFFAASGDSGTVSYPSSNPNVVSVGGTSLLLDNNGNYSFESGWQGSGGGLSTLYPNRPTPDISYDADPLPGFPVYDGGTWWEVGGTSAGSPQIAALYSLMVQKGVVNTSVNARVQFDNLPPSDYRDITVGAGQAGNVAGPGYDLMTGYGTPIVPNLFQPPNERYVRQLYNKLLNRAGEDVGVAYYQNLLDSGMSTYSVAVSFTNSVEYYHIEVNKVFEEYLGRPVEDNFFSSGIMYTDEQLVVIVSTSNEALASGEFNFVNNLYVNEMGKPVDPISYHYFATLLERGVSPQDVASVIAVSEQHHENQVSVWYNEIMRRNVDAIAETYWTNLLTRGIINDVVVIDSLFGSEEYLSRV